MRAILPFLILLLAPSASAASTIAIEAYAFHPGRIEVVAGEVITVTNADIEPHALKASDGGEFFLDVPAHGEATFRVPDAPGEFAYYCPYHTSPTAEGDFMKGVLVVRAAAPLPESTPSSPDVTPTPGPAPTHATVPVPYSPLALVIGIAVALGLRKR